MHTIRLGPPWVVVTHAGRTTHSRNFGSPRTLDAGERLWLVCAAVPAATDVSVNGEALASVEVAGPFAVNITDRVRPRNVVVFAVAAGETLGAVTLEVRQSI